MGLGHFLDSAAKATGNAVKGAAWVANPTHYDDIARGAGKAAEFVVEHPGQTAHIAGEVGKAIVKDQLKPQNLAINAALIGATVLTGGAAAPALAAKLGLGAKSIEAGVAAGEGIEAGATALKAGTTAVEAGSTALKAGETAAEVGNAASKTTKALRVADKVLGAEKTAGKYEKFIRPISTLRGKAGEAILKGGGEAPSL